ncbi:hypothetical protein [Pelosinus baikalensis]|uniref:Uncharacterized protein n=1 Tax=Pelosinus baikalensis TaxID=2892015 RepID=A0ABS8HZF5_9FIRM|nr:hypothetical protein [Pelosinus baikalensis]MCC5468545.1 hypothetical protein [Pelosinus baikalensis]
MKKALISGMFSSVSDAELITQMLDFADLQEDTNLLYKDLNQRNEKNR